LVFLVFLVLLLNLPFGYWRAGVPRFSVPWVLAIHLPVPAIVALRLSLGIGWAWFSFPPLVGAFFLGQYCGAGLKRRWQAWGRGSSLCLAMDLVRLRVGRRSQTDNR
jgi:hypothetical protein